MKKTILFFSIVALILSTCSINVSANNLHSTSTTIEYISDDIYIETIIIEEQGINFFSTTNTKTASKIYNIKNSSNEILATFKLTGIFSYNGNTSSCTRSSHSTAINDTRWKFVSSTSSKSGNVAIGTFTAKYYLFEIETQTISKTITITCDANGNIS